MAALTMLIPLAKTTTGLPARVPSENSAAVPLDRAYTSSGKHGFKFWSKGR